MVTVPRSELQAGASDTESNSERDAEVRQRLRHSITSLHLLVAGVNKAQSLLTSGAPGGVGGGQESLGQRLVGTGSLERRSGVGQSALLRGLATFLCVRASAVNRLSSCRQVLSWKTKLPLQTIMRLLQVLVPQVEKICIDK